jgi:hypothetical protein
MTRSFPVRREAKAWAYFILIGLFLAAMAGCLPGCATNTSAHTASGRPERTVSLSAEAAKARITEGMLNKGFTLRSDSSAQPSFYRPGNTGTGGLIGANFGAKASFTVVPHGDSSRVIVDIVGIGHPGTIAEGPMPLNNWNGGAEALRDVNAVLASL